MAACLNVAVDIIEPCGFDLSDRALRRAALDYYDKVSLRRHPSFEEFLSDIKRVDRRLILLTTKGAIPYHDVLYRDNDVILAGRESAGAPDKVHECAHLRARIPMQESLRSLNVALSVAMVLGEALGQTGGFSRFL
ncbi:tRNA (cytidine(34)-2'-O)-methyltransferase [Rhodomicrobium sp. Az07]|uniref:tRNA (cytidine(34)-2'-O)-methyltransferase n=1 Tax=Rhodomicrobium sp. Az07 TaxID=2839034 RepID=UPI0035304955